RRKVDDRTRIQDPARRMGRPAGPDGRCWTFNEIAEHLGVSTERARQIERLGVLMLRHPVYGLEIRSHHRTPRHRLRRPEGLRPHGLSPSGITVADRWYPSSKGGARNSSRERARKG